MVDRKLNKPVCKIKSFPVFWLRQIGVQWWCRQCGSTKDAGTVAFEICVRQAGKGLTKDRLGEQYDKAIKMYVCLDCADKLLGDARDNVKLCKSVGPEGYALFTRV